MYVVRDIFQLKFGHYKDVKALLDESKNIGMFLEEGNRFLTDFTGDAYRLIFEHSYKTLAEYEGSMANMGKPEWGQWYAKFSQHMEGSHREILKLIM